MKFKVPILLFLLLPLAANGLAFPFWLESASRRNPNDPKSDRYIFPPNTPLPSLNTLTYTRTGTPDLTAAASPTWSSTVTATRTETPAPSATPGASDTPSPSGTPSPSAVDTATFTPLVSPTDSPTASPTYTPADTVTDTSTRTPSGTPSATPSDSPTRTVTLSATPTRSPTPSATPSPTNSPSPVFSPTNTPLPRGATLAYDEYEAESGYYSGVLLGPSFNNSNVAAESSNRRAVRLDATGHYVGVTAASACNAIVVRLSVPDSAGGGGSDYTLSLYVDGVHRQDLNVTSRYSWDYGGWSIPYGQNPASGTPVHQYDEVRAFIPGGVAAGSTITLQKDAADTAAFYVVDLIDLEQVGAALAQPGGSLSASTYGAVPNDAGDDTTSLQNLINAAQAAGKVAYIPAGTYEISSPLSVPAVAIQGAGMWHTVIHQNNDTSGFRINVGTGSFYIGDLALLGEVTNRVDTTTDSGLDYRGGNGSQLARVWIEHFKCGWWVGSSGTLTDNLLITGCRFRNLYADAVNFCNGASNSTVTQSHARGVGDDAFASWSPSFDGVNTNNLFSFNTIQQPWRADGIAIYGGSGNKVEDNIISDTYNYPGIRIGNEFGSNAFSGTTSVRRNTLVRAGGRWNAVNEGAIKVAATEGGISGVVIEGNTIEAPVYYGIHFSGANAVSGTIISSTTINGASSNCMRAEAATTGTVNCDNVAVTASGALSSGGMSFVKGAGNTGW